MIGIKEFRSLHWFKEHGPTPFLDVIKGGPDYEHFPTLDMRKSLVERGLIDEVGPGLLRYKINEAGLAALREAEEMMANMRRT